MIIHQVLHGYRDGHNMLASSARLSARDDDLLKILSDWSEYAGGTDGDSSYITAYPLCDDNLYAVGKTWYADEKERPGCVWTHTLLLDISHLDALFDFRCLMSLFRRPVDGEYELYGEPIVFSVSEDECVSSFGDSYDLVWLMYLYVHLLQPSSEKFIVEHSSEFYQHLCLTLMQHLPISILKERTFSSGSNAGRLLYGRPFSLQFVSFSGVRLSNSKEIASLKISNFDSGIAAICSTINADREDMSPFLRFFDDDIDGDVAKLSAVGELYSFMDENQSVNETKITFDEVIKVIVDAFPNINEGRNVKSAFLGKNVSNLFANEEDVIYVLSITRAYKSFDYCSINYEQRADDIATSDVRNKYFAFLKKLVESEYLNEYGQSLLKNSVNRLSVQDLAIIITKYWNTYVSLTSMCPQLLANGLWVDLENEHFVYAYEFFSCNTISNFSAWDKLFRRVLYQHYPIHISIWDGFLSNVQTIVEDVMDYLNKSVKYELDSRLEDYVSENVGRVSLYLSGQSTISEVTKEFVVSSIDPKSPKIASTDSISWKIVGDSIDSNSHSECVFLFLLSFNWKDINSLTYLKKAYYPIYKLLQSNNLEWSLWNKIADYTERLFPWQEWDKCKKLRKGIVKYLREAGYSRGILMTFTPENALNDDLLKIWDNSSFQLK